jgi:hypothetical protein
MSKSFLLLQADALFFRDRTFPFTRLKTGLISTFARHFIPAPLSRATTIPANLLKCHFTS